MQNHIVLIGPESILPQDGIVWLHITQYLVSSLPCLWHFLREWVVNTGVELINVLNTINHHCGPVIAVVEWGGFNARFGEALISVAEIRPEGITLIAIFVNHDSIDAFLTEPLDDNILASHVKLGVLLV